MTDQDCSHSIQQQVAAALADKKPLKLIGGNSKAFYGRETDGEPIQLAENTGILEYEPTELVITARAGTRLSEIEDALAAAQQMLPFEPPHFSPTATLGGTVACNFSGPRRPHAGAARDLILGTKIINGKAEMLTFGGKVMKNVAGYDVSRLMAGSLGTLGILLEISLKVLPKPEQEITLQLEMEPVKGLDQLHRWNGSTLPISATCIEDHKLTIRLSGTADVVRESAHQIGGTELAGDDPFWMQIKEHRLDFFTSSKPLWRLSIASDTPPIDLPGNWLYEWGGALRWLSSDAPTESIRKAALDAGGHATLFRSNLASLREAAFQPLPSGLLKIHRNLKQAFDPHNILNPNRMYPGI